MPVNPFHIPVVYYHSLAPQKHKNWFRKYLTLELNYFEDQLKFFQKNHIETLHLNELFNLRKNGQNSNKQAICLTFDDGFLDNYIYLFPLLQKYKAKATIFVNPEFVDVAAAPRLTLQNYWNGKCNLADIDHWGYLSWEEMRIMEKSGLVDIQSHTMTHTKFFVSDKIVGFHYPGCDCLYPVGNLFPELKPYYIDMPDFEKKLPYGYPYFEEKSAIVARQIQINPNFSTECVAALSGMEKEPYKFEILLAKTSEIYNKYKASGTLVISAESDEEYKSRVHFELAESKAIIEKELGKTVEFLCWPHGDNNEDLHKQALNLGYLATARGKLSIAPGDYTKIERIGLHHFRNNRLLTKWRTRYKTYSYLHKQPYLGISDSYYFFKKLLGYK